MANALTAHTIINGSRNLVIHFSGVADGSGDYSNFELLNVFDYQNEGEAVANDYSVLKIAGRNAVGTSMQLKFGSSLNNHVLFYQSPTDNEFSGDWTRYGGIHPKLVSSDGSIRISTTGYDAAADSLNFTIWLKKKVRTTK